MKNKKYTDMTALEFATSTYHKPVKVDEALNGRRLEDKILFFKELNELSRKMPHTISTNDVIANIFSQISEDIDKAVSFAGMQGLNF